jgi:hypothetical protein
MTDTNFALIILMVSMSLKTVVLVSLLCVKDTTPEKTDSSRIFFLYVLHYSSSLPQAVLGIATILQDLKNVFFFAFLYCPILLKVPLLNADVLIYCLMELTIFLQYLTKAEI